MNKLIDLIDPDLLTEEPEDPRYVNTPFRFLKKLLPKPKGSRYEKITSDVMKKTGHTVTKAQNRNHDRIIDGYKVEIKGSMLNKGTDHFSFLQIRPDQDYDKIFFVMFYPDELVIMEMTKEKIIENITLNNFTGQHGGKNAKSGTYHYYGTRETLLSIGATFVQ